MNDWPFPDAPNFNAFTTVRVMERQDPILAVYHERDDGAWQFVGGPWTDDELIVVCLADAVARDPSLYQLADLPRGWGAQRAGVGAPWERVLLNPEAEGE